MYYTVYRITNVYNGKIYIGVHKTKNLNDGYMGSGRHLKNAMKKYGKDSFRKEYIAIFDNPEKMYDMEAELVNEHFVSHESTYNIGLGGKNVIESINEMGKNIYDGHAEQWEKIRPLGINKLRELFENDVKFRVTHKVRVHEGLVAYYKNGGDNPFKGKKHSGETKRKIGTANSVHQKGTNNSQYGTCWIFSSEESKKIPKSELHYWISKGWKKGRKMT